MRVVRMSRPCSVLSHRERAWATFRNGLCLIRPWERAEKVKTLATESASLPVRLILPFNSL